MNIKDFNVKEVKSSELSKVNGGIIPFIIGYAVGIGLGAGGVIAGREVAKWWNE